MIRGKLEPMLAALLRGLHVVTIYGGWLDKPTRTYIHVDDVQLHRRRLGVDGDIAVLREERGEQPWRGARQIH